MTDFTQLRRAVDTIHNNIILKELKFFSRVVINPHPL